MAKIAWFLYATELVSGSMETEDCEFPALTATSSKGQLGQTIEFSLSTYSQVNLYLAATPFSINRQGINRLRQIRNNFLLHERAAGGLNPLSY